MLLISLADQTPEPEDVTAGAWGGLIFVLLILALALLMLSFLKQMRKTERARRQGVFGDVPEETAPTATTTDPIDETRPGRGL